MTYPAPAFAAPGRFWRGNLHTHSTNSDGALPPEEVCRRYREAGYDFLCLSDHLVGRYGYPISDTLPYRTNSFTTILGAEIHLGAMANGEIWHVLAVGLPEGFERPYAPDFEPDPQSEPMPDLARRCRDAGAFVALAHPQWNGMTHVDAELIEAAHAVEIYNHGCEVETGRGDGFAVLDTLLSAGRRLTACATDDAHFHSDDHFGGWVMVKAETLDPDALLEALKAGNYYSSQGPELHDVRVGGEEIVVSCSPVSRVMALGHGSAAKTVWGEEMSETRLPLEPFKEGGWLRVSVADAAGKFAWANPIHLA